MSVDANTQDPNLVIPDKSILYQIAGASYADDFTGNVDGFSLLKQTPTLKIFKKDDYPVIVVGVRGTADFQDLQAWLPVILDTIIDTDRYKQDTAVLKDFQSDYRPTLFYYYAVGHSLAGVIIDEWLKSGLVLKGRTYNPAIQLKDLQNTSINNDRVYASGDPLYKMFGKRAKKKPEVRQSQTVFGWDQAKQFALSPLYYFGKDTLREHTWRNPVFHGGARYRFQEL
jgi:hypothetical protein